MLYTTNRVLAYTSLYASRNFNKKQFLLEKKKDEES